ncbi:hypothetical protein NC652_034916 [Populus alba x Populus x berolinensis]|nr:hypothetical protein NC652_034916 [Populus alba x Populus x berolinensis]
MSKMKEVKKLAESIGSDRSTFIHCDVTDEKQVKSLVESTVALYGHLDIMFCNAGTLSFDKQTVVRRLRPGHPASQPIPVEASIQIMSCPSVRYWGWPLGVEEVEKTFESTSCLKGVLKLKHVANAVLFLASEDSEFVTGHDLLVDGSEDLQFLNQANSILRCNKLKGNRQMVEPCVLFPDGSTSGAVHVRFLLSFRFRRKTKSLRLTSLPLYY